MTKERIMNMIIYNGEKLYTTLEMAEFLKLKKATIQGMARDGRLKKLKIGRSYYYSEKELERVMREGTTK